MAILPKVSNIKGIENLPVNVVSYLNDFLTKVKEK